MLGHTDLPTAEMQTPKRSHVAQADANGQWARSMQAEDCPVSTHLINRGPLLLDDSSLLLQPARVLLQNC